MESILKSVRLARKLVEERADIPLHSVAITMSTPLSEQLEAAAYIMWHGGTELLPEPNLSLTLSCKDELIMNLIEDEMANGRDCSIVVYINGTYKSDRVTAILDDVWILSIDRELGRISIIAGGLQEKAEPNNEIVQLNEKRDPSLARFSDLWED